MDINYRHINSNKLPREILAIENKLRNLNKSLRIILEEELRNGNLVFDVNMDFPEKGSLQVSMQRPFYKVYEIDNVEKYEDVDPHYSGVEYSCGKPVHAIICPVK